MKTFSELNQKRQMAVQMLLDFHPDCKETGVVTLKQIKQWWADYSLKTERDIGYPIWLLSDDYKVSGQKATYNIPLPMAGEEVSKPEKKVKKLKDLTKVKRESKIETRTYEALSEEEFLAECLAAGVVFEK